MSYNSFQEGEGADSWHQQWERCPSKLSRVAEVLSSDGGDVPTAHLSLGSRRQLGQVGTILEVAGPVQTPLC